MEAILKFLGLWCDPSEAIPVPTYRPTKNKAPEPLSPDIRFDATGRPFKVVEEKFGSVSKEVSIGRTPKRTAGDEHVLAMAPPPGKPKMKPEKYFRLKVLWAKGVSAKDAASTLGHERGFKERTCDYYWAAFALSQRFDREGAESPTPENSES